MTYDNHVTLVGNLTQDPEITRSKTKFTLAVERPKAFNKVTNFFNVVAFGEIAENCSVSLVKGTRVLVDGRIQVRSYIENDQRKWVMEVVAESIKFLILKEVK